MLTILTSGFFVGVIYGLFAVGLVITYKGSRIVNFAHGEIGMVGTFLFTELWSQRHWNIVVAIAAGVSISAALGALTERLVARPLSDKSPLTALLGTFAVGGLLLAVASQVFGPNIRLQPPFVGGTGIRLAGLFISPQQLFAGAAAAVLITALTLFYNRTWLGFTLRATAMSAQAAEVVGVNVNRLSMLTWALGGALAACAGILISPLLNLSVFFMTALLVRGLSAALLAGFSSIPLAFGAAILIAEGEAYLQFKSGIAGLTEAVLAVTIIVALLLLPSRMSGAREALG